MTMKKDIYRADDLYIYSEWVVLLRVNDALYVYMKVHSTYFNVRFTLNMCAFINE